MIILIFQGCTSFLSPIFTNFISGKLERRKYIFFHFSLLLKYVKHTGKTDQEGEQVKKSEETNISKVFSMACHPQSGVPGLTIRRENS